MFIVLRSKMALFCKGEDQISFSSTVPLFLFRLTLSHKNTCIMQTTTSKNIMLRADSSPIIFVRKKDFCFCEKIQENKGTNCHHKWNYLHEFLPVREFSDSKTQEQDFFRLIRRRGPSFSLSSSMFLCRSSHNSKLQKSSHKMSRGTTFFFFSIENWVTHFNNNSTTTM